MMFLQLSNQKKHRSVNLYVYVRERAICVLACLHVHSRYTWTSNFCCLKVLVKSLSYKKIKGFCIALYMLFSVMQMWNSFVTSSLDKHAFFFFLVRRGGKSVVSLEERKNEIFFKTRCLNKLSFTSTQIWEWVYLSLLCWHSQARRKHFISSVYHLRCRWGERVKALAAVHQEKSLGKQIVAYSIETHAKNTKPEA